MLCPPSNKKKDHSHSQGPEKYILNTQTRMQGIWKNILSLLIEYLLSLEKESMQALGCFLYGVLV